MSWRKPFVRGFNHAAYANACAAGAATGGLRLNGFLLCFAALYCFCAVPAVRAADDSVHTPDEGLPLDKVAGLVHAIVASNREAYSQIVVNRLMVEEKVLKAGEQHIGKKLLPLPAQFFRAGAELAARRNARTVYSLQSFWSIYPQNLPKTELEKIGLSNVLGGTDHFYGAESSGNAKYFLAAYPDFATNEACVRCHNNHPESRRRDFVIGDVMGGVVVRIPLANANSQGEGTGSAGAAGNANPYRMSYTDVADLVNSIVTANREVYSSLVVARLARENVIEASEHYIENRCLPLPEQLFNVGAMLTSEKTHTKTFALRSAWPLNKGNLPASEVEKTGLAALAGGKDRFYGIEAAGGGTTFVAIYPDKAAGETCVSCHNQHPNGSRKDFKPGDVMGGVIVRIPLSN